MSAAIVIISSKCSVRSSNLKDSAVDTVYKRCGFRRADDFVVQHSWQIPDTESTIDLYARAHGKAGNENKYDLPPPADNDLFFGSIALIRKTAAGDVEDLTIEEWEKTYERLFGGFDDLAATEVSDELEPDELDSAPASAKTKHGYLKDGWIVDGPDGSELEEEEYED